MAKNEKTKNIVKNVTKKERIDDAVLKENEDILLDGDLSNISEETLIAPKLSEKAMEKLKPSRRKILEEIEGDNNVVTKPIEVVLKESMLPYSEFVILDRALPRVEDGLKPVQRRVLYSMLEVGVLPDKPYRKSARIVGDCMGKYHPHGDSSIYETMVRLAQDFNMGEVLVSGHGNFGSVDGDSAAAMRYTEARLAPIALELLRDIEKDTVSWSFNFDDSCKEPDMLPGRFPNLLVNGSNGIAVGLATNIPTHNLKETCEAVCAYISNPKITLEEIMQILPAPDFPTGAYILNNSEIKQVYETGKGKIYIRSKIHIENVDNDKKNIVIDEIPFQVNKASLLQRIAYVKEVDETGYLSAISDIVDESDRNGTRAVIKLKKDARVGQILAILYKQTDLQSTFNANIVAIADGKPKQLGLLEIISYYVNYQQQVIYRRTKYDLESALKKEHILEGLLIAINNIDEVVRIIKTSKSVTDAKIRLIETFHLSEAQAQAILDMRLARLTSLEVDKLVAELNRLKDLIKRYTAILKSPAMQLKIVKQELTDIAKNYGSERKSGFLNADDDLIVEEDNITNEENQEVNIIITPGRTIKSVSQKSYNLAVKELSANAQVFEVPELTIKTSTNRTIYLFTNIGNCIKIPVSKISQCKFKDRGANILAHCKNLEDHEKIVSMLDFDESIGEQELVFYTKNGMIKTSKINEYFASKQVIAAIKLKDDDQLINVEINKQDFKVALFTRNGIGSIVTKEDISCSGRVSVGFKGIALGKDDYVVSAFQITNGESASIVLNSGSFKALEYKEISFVPRNRKGNSVVPAKAKAFILKAQIANINNNYVLENQTNELFYLMDKQITKESANSLGKSLKNLKGDNILKNAYYYKII